MSRVAWTLEAVNERLKGCPVKIYQRGDRLHLRATLPPRTGSGLPKQQFIPLTAAATPDGFKWAEARALELAGQIRSDRFSWEAWIPEEKRERIPLVIDQIKAFEKKYRASHQLTDRTWERHWDYVFRRLRQDKPLTQQGILAVVLRTDPDTRERKQVCLKLQHLADFAGVEIDLGEFEGSYGRSKTKPLLIPADEVLLEAGLDIRSIPWRNYYGLSLCYGLRPHEAAFSRLNNDQDRTLSVDDGKTGSRITYPLRPEWLDPLELWGEVELPLIGSRYKAFRELSDRVWKGYKRCGVMDSLPDFTPRILRYAYCVRGVVNYGIPIPVMAQWLGHSPEVLLSTYSRYINAATHRDTFRSRVLG